MATYTELNIINKLLLQKLQRIQNENKELCFELYKVKQNKNKYYNELNTLKKCVNTSDCSYCDKCFWESKGKMWFHYDDLHGVNDYVYCDNCYDNYCWDCDLCGENFDNEDEEQLKFLDLTRWWDCCKNCYEERMKEKYDEVMKELKERFLQPFCITPHCCNKAALNKYYPNSMGGKYWNKCNKCYIEEHGEL